MDGTLDLDTPRWMTPDLCAAAGIDGTTFKNWCRSEPRAVMMGERDRAAGGSGGRHLFTLRRVLQVAIAAEFVGAGLQPRLAGMAAFACTDEGQGPLPGLPERLPGHLYPTGWTVVLINRHGPCVVNMDPKATLESQSFLHLGGFLPTDIRCVANFVYGRVLRTLGQPAPTGVEVLECAAA
jgi:hypothetical protein